MALTAVAINKAKGRAKPYELTDGDGLFLYVTPNGGRYHRTGVACHASQDGEQGPL